IYIAAQTDDRSVELAGNLDLRIHFAGMVHRHEIFAAILDPPYRAASMSGGKGYEEILGIELAARAERSTDIDLDQLDPVDGKPEHLRQQCAIEEDNFCRAVDGELPLSFIPHGQQAARFHRQGEMALDAETLPPRIGRGGESLFRVTLSGGHDDRAVGA